MDGNGWAEATCVEKIKVTKADHEYSTMCYDSYVANVAIHIHVYTCTHIINIIRIFYVCFVNCWITCAFSVLNSLSLGDLEPL